MKLTLFGAAGLALILSFAPTIGHAKSFLTTTLQKSTDQNPQATKTFTGTVTRQGDLYILTDKADKTNYQLDDPKKASAYEGKAVKVTGTLDAENLTIHIKTIDEIS
jgi:hypothetical protein